MFTGIIEELGSIDEVKKQGETISLSIKANKIMEDIKLGDSIAINGVCLTVTDIHNNRFFADVMPETFQTTTLANLQKGTSVNLERAMRADSRFGGHIVTGHVDTIGKITKRERRQNAIYIDISLPPNFKHIVLLKGSIAIDGISLTVFNKADTSVTVSIIPHTANETVLGKKRVGEDVNIEFDVIGKYIYSIVGNKESILPPNTISNEFLKEHGFS